MNGVTDAASPVATGPFAARWLAVLAGTSALPTLAVGAVPVVVLVALIVAERTAIRA